MKAIFKILFTLSLVAFFVSCKPNPYRQYRLSKRDKVRIHGQKVKPSKEVMEIEAAKAEQKELDKERLEHNLKVQNSKNKKKYLRQKTHNAPFSHH